MKKGFTGYTPFILVLSYLILVLATSVLGAQGAQSTDDVRQQTASRKSGSTASLPAVCAACIRAHMEFLASDALRGRGSGTHDELVAATYIASQFRAYGIQPAGDDGGYVEHITVIRRRITAPPELYFTTPGNGVPAQSVTWMHGKEILVFYLSQPEFSGPLQKIDVDGGEVKVKPGAVVFLTGKEEKRLRKQMFRVIAQGAIAVLMPPSANLREHWQELGKKLPELPPELEGAKSDMQTSFNALAVNEEAQRQLKDLPEGTVIAFKVAATAPQASDTWNAVGILPGRDPAQKKNAVLLTAHLDHLGIGPPVDGDDVYNGADDDASGTTAVLELARVLKAGPKPRRTVIFALFGSEETGGLGSTYFREHPPLPLKDIAANLEFEMIGRPDPREPDDALWLTGWERSDLGPELAQHGAKLVRDPHPQEGFFRRSDNYVLAKKGVVAQTVSSFGLHEDYHQPSDDLAHIDFEHMIAAIQSLIRPIEWLVNSDFRPQWNTGGQP